VFLIIKKQQLVGGTNQPTVTKEAKAIGSIRMQQFINFEINNQLMASANQLAVRIS